MVLEIISEQEYAVWVYVCENGKCDRELMLKPYGKIELEVMDSIELVEIKFHNKLRVIDNVILAISGHRYTIRSDIVDLCSCNIRLSNIIFRRNRLR